MHRFHARRLAAIVAATFANALFCATSFGVEIPISALLGPAPTFAGDGLLASYYDVDTVTNLGEADEVIAATTPNATFKSTLIDYTPGDVNVIESESTMLQSFLGGDAAGLDPTARTSTVNGSIFSFSGFIRIDESFDRDLSDDGIDVNFKVGSDDGFRLVIGGVEVSSFNSLRNFNFSNGHAEFAAAGLYSFELIYFENTGFAGLEFNSSISGGPDSGAPSGSAGILPADILYSSLPLSTPEPSSLLMAGMGLAGAFGCYRYTRRRR